MNYLKSSKSLTAVFLLFIAIVRCNNNTGKQSHELQGTHTFILQHNNSTGDLISNYSCTIILYSIVDHILANYKGEMDPQVTQ